MDKLTFEEILFICGAIGTITSAVAIVIRPFNNINKSLVQTAKIISDLEKEMKQTRIDREKLHAELKEHDDRLDDHNIRIEKNEWRLGKIEEEFKK